MNIKEKRKRKGKKKNSLQIPSLQLQGLGTQWKSSHGTQRQEQASYWPATLVCLFFAANSTSSDQFCRSRLTASEKKKERASSFIKRSWRVSASPPPPLLAGGSLVFVYFSLKFKKGPVLCPSPSLWVRSTCSSYFIWTGVVESKLWKERRGKKKQNNKDRAPGIIYQNDQYPNTSDKENKVTFSPSKPLAKIKLPRQNIGGKYPLLIFKKL